MSGRNRHLDYGGIATGGLNCVAGPIGGSFRLDYIRGVANAISSRGRLASSDLRVGMIWLLGGPASAPPAAIAVKD
jgi:hypothetical protein